MDASDCAKKFLHCLGIPQPEAPPLRRAWFFQCLTTWPGGLLLALCAAAFALGFALTAQYGFGFRPCVLCLWQRVPYILVLPVTLAGLFWPPLRPWRGALLLGCGALFFLDSALAAFHFGVEQHWWLGTSGCAIQAAVTPADAGSLRQALLSSPVARCDEISWRFLGLSMTGWNFLYALGAALMSLYLVLFGKNGQPCKAPNDLTSSDS